ncbi:MAG: site-specific integrase [Synergistaceae bacterium]|nr:site-specific integrase [Synergistaceae bacterium]
MEVQPIRDPKKIIAMRELLREENPRDEVLFILGINTALRISDLLSLTLSDVTDISGKISEEISMKEQKTGKVRSFPLNRVVRESLADWLPRLEANLNASLFPSQKNGGKAITRWHARRVLAAAGEAVGLKNIGTHSLRKTFGYHAFMRWKSIELVQKLLGHSSPAITLRYIGITREEMDTVYLDLNLGEYSPSL